MTDYVGKSYGTVWLNNEPENIQQAFFHTTNAIAHEQACAYSLSNFLPVSLFPLFMHTKENTLFFALSVTARTEIM